MKITYTNIEAVNAMTKMLKRDNPNDSIEVIIEDAIRDTSNVHGWADMNFRDMLKRFGYSGNSNFDMIINTAKQYIPSGRMNAINEVLKVSRGLNNIQTIGIKQAKEFVDTVAKYI